MSQFDHIGGVFPGRHWSSLVVIGCHWQSSVFRRTPSTSMHEQGVGGGGLLGSPKQQPGRDESDALPH